MTALHGFLGRPRDWDAIPCTTGAYKVDWMPVLAGLPGGPDEPVLPALANALNSQPAGDTLVGYSMGGRIALHMLVAPNGGNWRRAIIVSASPGLAGAPERTPRRESDKNWARRFRDESWREVVTAWNGQGVFATDCPSPLTRTETDFDRRHLALALTRGSIGTQEDLREKLARLEIPILWVAGENDAKYAALAKECAALNPRFRFEILPNAGHRAPWTAPEAFCKAIGSSRSHNQ